MEDERGRGKKINARRIGTLLHDYNRTVRLTVLNACEGGRTSRTDPFAGVAATLIRQGIPAVAAMQFKISDDAAVFFADEFYSALSDGFSVDTSVAEARKRIYIEGNDVEWGTPVLYTSSRDGILFRFPEKPAAERPVEPEPEPEKKALKPKPKRQTDRVIEVTEEEKPAEKRKEKSPAKTETPPERFTNSLGMEFVYIRPGTFMMGSPEDEPGHDDNESLHKVTLTKAFYMQATQVTQGQWKSLMGNNPSYFKDGGDNCPVERVSWNDVQEFLKKLNQKEKGDKYRLPTEAEWEYSCRAGSSTRYCFGDDEDQLSEYAWYSKNSGGKTHPVGEKKSNAWGLCDMHGNVWEWCRDWHGDYPTGPVTDPTGPEKGSNRVERGGSWLNSAGDCRSAYRISNSPGGRYDDLGLRLALSPGQR